MPRERPIIFSGSMIREILAGRKTMTRRPVKDLRVRLRHEVSSDLPPLVCPVRKARAGAYQAKMNLHGAVAVELPREPGSTVRPFLGVKPQEFDFLCPYAEGHTYLRRLPDGRGVWHLQVPEGQRLRVRETWFEEFDPVTCRPYDPPRACYAATHEGEVRKMDGDGGTVFRRDGTEASPWRPGIHMPRWASRLLLEVESVRVERLHAITEEDARAEGFTGAEETGLEYRDDAGRRSARTQFCARWSEMYEGTPFFWTENPWVWVVTFRRVEAARSAA